VVTPGAWGLAVPRRLSCLMCTCFGVCKPPFVRPRCLILPSTPVCLCCRAAPPAVPLPELCCHPTPATDVPPPPPPPPGATEGGGDPQGHTPGLKPASVVKLLAFKTSEGSSSGKARGGSSSQVTQGTRLGFCCSGSGVRVC
jgi:hypothetical protein